MTEFISIFCETDIFQLLQQLVIKEQMFTDYMRGESEKVLSASLLVYT